MKVSKKFVNKNKKKIILLICISAFLIIILSIFSLFIPRISLKDKIVILNINESYIEPGYTSKNIFKNLTKKVKVKNNINILETGNYKVIYEVKYLFFDIKKERKVIVKDKEPPVITLNGNENTIVCPNTTYVEEGYIVTDNYAKNIKDKVKLKIAKDKITYTVKDSFNNKTSVIRNLTYKDEESPNITLKGSKTIYLYLNNKYQEYGYTANDNCDGDITDKVVVNNNINASSIGTYDVTYTVSDSNNNSSSITRTIKVINNNSVNNDAGDGKIYLTFDDGPSPDITPKILDILSEENVKATFFVINKSDSLNYLIKREHDEGHTIGLHSSSHVYSNIYFSVDNYFNDLNNISNKVKNITGIDSKIIRFPGGSSNTVSRGYCTGIMTILASEVTNRGYIYVDWNVGSGDAGGANNTTEVYNNVINGLSHGKTNVVLMHDFGNNYKTLNALRDIIKYGKGNGYTFSNITESTPRVVQRIAN